MARAKLAKRGRAVRGLSPFFAPAVKDHVTCGGCKSCLFDRESKGYYCEKAYDANGRWCGNIFTARRGCLGWQARERV